MRDAKEMREMTRREFSDFRNLLNMFEAQIMRAVARQQYETKFNINYVHKNSIAATELLLTEIGYVLDQKGYTFDIEYFENGQLKVRIDWRELYEW